VLTLAGKPCNVYGNDVEVLNLKVEYQAQNRLAVNISPAYIVSIFGADVCLIWLICG
jgi:alpha-glucosidase